jgi:hypothetical protein
LKVKKCATSEIPQQPGEPDDVDVPPQPGEPDDVAIDGTGNTDLDEVAVLYELIVRYSA